jgi:hypothetical protein
MLQSRYENPKATLKKRVPPRFDRQLIKKVTFCIV